MPLGERHLRAVVSEYIVHYHEERNHQGLDNQLISPRSVPTTRLGAVKRRERVGGILSYYHREAEPRFRRSHAVSVGLVGEMAEIARRHGVAFVVASISEGRSMLEAAP